MLQYLPYLKRQGIDLSIHFYQRHCLDKLKFYNTLGQEEEGADLESFDIGVMPLADDLWSRGKCGFKIVQYYGVGVPVVCTPVGVNRDLVENGGSGFWAETQDEWIRSILKLMQDDGLRKEMGVKGREKVEREYSLQVNAPRLLGVLRKVLS